jgi:hypothetical protein
LGQLLRKMKFASVDWLFVGTAIYLFLPLIIFFLGWLSIWWAIVSVLLLFSIFAVGVESALKNPIPFLVSTSTRLAVSVTSLIWAALSGAGGCGYQNYDWSKHNAVLKDLILQRWPVSYLYSLIPWGQVGSHYRLVYYLAYYLPSAAIGKATNWNIANFSLYLWTAIGCGLTLFWFIRLSGRSAWIWAIFFIFLSGLDAPAYLLSAGKTFGMTQHLEWWNSLWQYSSNTTLLFWVPNQALGAWLATALTLHALTNRGRILSLPLGPVALLCWCPLPLLGLSFMGLPGLFMLPWRQSRVWLLAVSGLFLTLVFGLFYQSIDRQIVGGFNTGHSPVSHIFLYTMFIFFEAIIYFAIIWWLEKSSNFQGEKKTWRNLTYLAIVCLGVYNDFVMRVSIPFLLILWIRLAQLFEFRRVNKLSTWIAVFVIALGAITPMCEITRAIKRYSWGPRRIENVKTVPLVDTIEFVKSYIGSSDALFFRIFTNKKANETPPILE